MRFLVAIVQAVCLLLGLFFLAYLAGILTALSVEGFRQGWNLIAEVWGR